MTRHKYTRTLEYKAEPPYHSRRSNSRRYEDRLCAELTILNKHGMHARPAAEFIKIASKYDADVIVEKDGKRVSGKGIIGLLTLELSQGTKIRIYVNGNGDARACLDELTAFINSGCNNDDKVTRH